MSVGLNRVEKLAIVSCAIPPQIAGQALILQRLLADWSPQKYCLISSSLPEDGAKDAKTNCYFIGKKNKLSRQTKRSGFIKLLKQLQYLTYFPKKVWALLSIIKKEHIGAVLACSGDLTDLPACYLACALTETPLYIYMFDDYAFQWPWKFIHVFANLLCKFLTKKAR